MNRDSSEHKLLEMSRCKPQRFGEVVQTLTVKRGRPSQRNDEANLMEYAATATGKTSHSVSMNMEVIVNRLPILKPLARHYGVLCTSGNLVESGIWRSGLA